MGLKIAVLAAGLLCALQTAAAAGPDQGLRRQIADLSNKNCKTDPKIRKLLPSVQARLCNCFSAKFTKSLSSADILHVRLGIEDKSVDAAWDKKSNSALLACLNGG